MTTSDENTVLEYRWMYTQPDILGGPLGLMPFGRKPTELEGYFTEEELGRKKNWCRKIEGSERVRTISKSGDQT